MELGFECADCGMMREGKKRRNNYNKMHEDEEKTTNMIIAAHSRLHTQIYRIIYKYAHIIFSSSVLSLKIARFCCGVGFRLVFKPHIYVHL